jgi:hypothetical protein
MRVLREAFDQREAAEAFLMGIELANDPDLAGHEPRDEDGKHAVYLHDWSSDEEEVCPICLTGAAGEAEGCVDKRGQ